MGFSQFFKIIDSDEYRKQVDSLPIHQSLNETKDKIWLLLDLNNIRFQSNLLIGNHSGLQRIYEEQFWKSLLVIQPNLYIKIFCDGKYNDGLRTVIKLNRELSNISNPFSATDDNEAYFREACSYGIFMEQSYEDVIESIQLSKVHNDRLEIIQCKSEADPEIRKFANKVTDLGDQVLVISDDASLILGIDKNIYINRPSKFLVTSLDTPFNIFDNAIPVFGSSHSFCCVIENLMYKFVKFTSKYFDDLKSVHLDSKCLLIMSSLMGGEYQECDERKDSSPSLLLDYLTSFIFPESSPYLKSKGNYKLSQFGYMIASTALILSWKHSLGDNFSQTEYRSFQVALEQVKKSVNANTGQIYGICRGEKSKLRKDKEIQQFKTNYCTETLLPRICGNLVDHDDDISNKMHLYKMEREEWCEIYEPSDCTIDTNMLLHPLSSLKYQYKTASGTNHTEVEENLDECNIEYIVKILKMLDITGSGYTSDHTSGFNEISCEIFNQFYKFLYSESYSKSSESSDVSGPCYYIVTVRPVCGSFTGVWNMRELYNYVIRNNTLPTKGILVPDRYRSLEQQRLSFGVEFCVMRSDRRIELEFCKSTYNFWSHLPQSNPNLKSNINSALFDLSIRRKVLLSVYKQTCYKSHDSSNINMNIHNQRKISVDILPRLRCIPHVALLSKLGLYHHEDIRDGIDSVYKLWESQSRIKAFMDQGDRLLPLQSVMEENDEIYSTLYCSSTFLVSTLYCMFILFTPHDSELKEKFANIVTACLLSPLFGLRAHDKYWKHGKELLNGHYYESFITSTNDLNAETSLSNKKLLNINSRVIVENMVHESLECALIELQNDYNKNNSKIEVKIVDDNNNNDNEEGVRENHEKNNRYVGSLIQLRWLNHLLLVIKSLLKLVNRNFRCKSVYWLDGHGIGIIIRVLSLYSNISTRPDSLSEKLGSRLSDLLLTSSFTSEALDNSVNIEQESNKIFLQDIEKTSEQIMKIFLNSF